MSSEQFKRDKFIMQANHNEHIASEELSDDKLDKRISTAAKKILALTALVPILLTAGCNAEKDKAPYENDRVAAIGSILIDNNAEVRTDPFRGDNENPTLLLTPKNEETVELSNGAYVEINAASGKINIGVKANETTLDSEAIKKDRDGIVWGEYGDIIPFDKDGKLMSEDDLIIATSSLNNTSQETTEDWAS